MNTLSRCFLSAAVAAIAASGCAGSGTGDELSPVVARSVADDSLLLAGVYAPAERMLYLNADLSAEVAAREAAGDDVVLLHAGAVIDLAADGTASLEVDRTQPLQVVAKTADGAEPMAGFLVEAPELLETFTEADGATSFPGCYFAIR